MSAAKIIKQVMQEQNISVKMLAEKLGIQAASMSNKLYRDNFSFAEFCKIMDIMDTDVKAITRATGKEFY